MPKLIMRVDDRVVKEYVIGTSATIGRLPDNTVMIDNPAISSHHARIFHDGDRFIVEDLKSKNGTFVNDKLVLTRRTLQTGDVVLVGKHQLVFDEAVLVDDAEAVLDELGDTVYLDTQGHREFLAKLRAIRWAKKPTTEAANEQSRSPPTRPGRRPARAGGPAQRPEYTLEANIALIGTSEQALVRLTGLVQAEGRGRHRSTRRRLRGDSDGGEPEINNQPLRGRHNLKEGDVLDVSGIVLEFRWSG